VTGLLGKKPAGADSPAYTGLDLQTSALGVAIPVLIGKDRLVPNLIWFGDFKATKGKVQGGKGGVVSGGKGATGVQEYSASVMLAFCEGTVGGSAGGWNSKSYTSMSALGMTLFDGAQTTPWGYLTTSHSADAFVYPGTAYAAVANLQLGNSPTIGNFSFEIQHTEAGSYGSESDKDIAEICELVLTHPRLGVNFADAGDFTDAKNYCKSLGLIGSLYVREQAPVRDLLARLAKSANLEWLWSGGELKLIPLGDENTSGNGYSWTASLTPLYDLDEDDFIGRVETERSRASDAKNSVTIEWKDRANEYNVTTTTAKDEASIAQIGVRAASAIQAPHWKKPEPAMLSAQFELARYAKRNAYRAKVDARYSHLEPLDTITKTDALAEITAIPARIERVTIAPDGSVTIQTKERLAGLGNAAAYTFETSTRPGEDFNAAAPDVATPYLFEPPPSLTTGRRELWIAVNGPGIWGGCDVYVSDDDTTYRLANTIYGGARYGALTTTLPTGSSPDTAHTPRVDLTVSEGELTSGTTADAEALNTLSLIGNELIAYRDADLVSAGVYDLGYLVRGARGTTIASHAIGAKFVRLDVNIATYEFAEDRVGSTLYLKFVSFNHTGGGRQAIEDVTAYTHVLTGASFALQPAEPPEWDDVLDGGGRKPDDNATVGAPAGTYVGGVEAATLVTNLAAVETAVADLETIYGDTVSAAASAAAAAISAADALAAKNLSVSAKDLSVAAQAASEAAKDLSVAAKNLAVTAKNDAQSAYAAAASEAANALAQATAASGSATAAAGSASTASFQASAAAGSASAAAASVTAATTQASNASVSASNAATSATNASNSASAASASAVTAYSNMLASGRPNMAARSNFTVSGATAAIVDLAWGNSGWGIRLTGTGATVVSALSGIAPLSTSLPYSVSFRAKLTSGTSQSIDIDLFPDTLPQTAKTVTTTDTLFKWENITSAHADMATATLRIFKPSLGAGVVVEVTDIKFEQGVDASAWTPGPRDARDYASASATSASSAATQATNASNSASAASTSATNAATSAGAASTSAGAASTSATSASNSASTATTQANNAAISATAAANSATAAGGSASAAATSASTASTQATNAGNSATSAAASAVSAKSSMQTVFGASLSNPEQWSSSDGSLAGAPYAAGAAAFTTASGIPVFRTTASAQGVLCPVAYFVPVVGRTYRATAVVRRIQNVSNGRASTVFVGVWGVRSSDTAYTGGQASFDGTSWTLNAWQTLTYDFAASVAYSFLRPRSHWNYNVSTLSDAIYEYQSLTYQDVTSELAAAGSATAAASSASSASTSATAAGTSATAASTSATNAATSAGAASTSAGAASTSASSAATSASTATTQANNASTSATAAANSATAAGGSASAAASSASTASTQATNAGNSATSASASAVSAKSSAAATIPSNFTDSQQWVNGGGSYTIASSKLVTTAAFGAPYSLGRIAVVSGHTYRITIRSRVTTNGSIPANNATFFGALALNAAGSGLGDNWPAYVNQTVASGWATSTATLTAAAVLAAYPTAAFLSAKCILGWDSVSGGSSGASCEADLLELIDITESTAAAGSASAAATSASAASTSAGTAGTQASAASTSATNAATSASSASTSAASASGSATAAAGSATSASTYASNAATSATNAGTQATNATTSATNASNSAAAAAASAVLSASVGQLSLNTNPVFADWTNSGAYPPGYASWGGTWARVTGAAATSPYALQSSVTSGNQAGPYQAVSIVSGNWYVMGCEFTFDSGSTLNGAGLTVTGTYNLNFYTEADSSGAVIGAGTNGRTYAFSKLFRSAGTATYNLHGMTQWDGFAANDKTRTLTWRRLYIRHATQIEIELGLARGASATLSAEIASKAATAASATAAVATSVTTLSAAVYANPNLFANGQFTQQPLTGAVSNSIGIGGPDTSSYPDLAPSVLLKSYGASATVGDYNSFLWRVPIGGRTGYLTLSAGHLQVGQSTGDLLLYAQGITGGTITGGGTSTQAGYTSIKNGDSRSQPTKRFSATVNITTASDFVEFGLLYTTGNAYGGTGGFIFSWDWKLEWGAVATARSAEAQIVSAQSVAVDTAGKMAALYSVDVSTSASKAGFVISSGAVSYFDVYADRFRIWDGAQRNLIFQIVGGQVQIQDALIRSLSVYPSAAATIAHKPQLRPNLYSGADGATITFPGSYGTGNIPYIKWAGGIPPVVSAGETYDISATSPSPTGFVVRAKKFTPGTPTTYSTTSTTNPGGTPAWRAPKPNTLDADGGAYVYKFSGTALCVSSIEEVPGSGNWETNWSGDVQLWYRAIGGSFTLARTETVAFSSTEASQKTAGVHTKAFSNWEAPVNLPAIGADDGSKHFGIHASTGATITAFASVAYTATSTSSVSALPGSFTFEVYAPS
jgi:hypothetical protein